MKYKSAYIGAYEHAKDGKVPNESDLISWVFGALRGGGICCFDFDIFGS